MENLILLAALLVVGAFALGRRLVLEQRALNQDVRQELRRGVETD